MTYLCDMNKTIALTILSTLLLAFTSCEKFALDESKGTDDVSDNSGNVNLSIDTSFSQAYSRLTWSFFSMGNKVKNINQTSDDKHFGQVSIALDEGEYQWVVIAHNGLGHATISKPEKVTFASNKTTDTSYHYGSLQVEDETIQQTINLDRAVALIRIHIKDAIPATAKRLKLYYTGGSSTLDATTGYGCINSRQTEEREMSTDQKDYDIYTFPHSDGKKLHIVVTAYDAAGKTLATQELQNVEVKKNQCTTCSLNLFGGEEDEGSGVSFEFDPSWEGQIHEDF